jgi:hypothetical protein
MHHTLSRRRALILGAVMALVLSGCFYHQNTPWTGGSFDRPNTRTQIFRIGPYDLAGINQPGWEVKGNDVMPHPAGNVAIKGIDFRVVDGDGHHVGLHLVHLHHIVLLDRSSPDPICPEVGARFAGTGTERTPLVLPGRFAYRVDAGDVWGSTFHLHTTSATPAEDVYIEYEVQYEPITAQSDFQYTTPYFLDVTGCWSNSGSLYDVPGGGAPGSEHIASKTYTAPRNGTAVFTGGHIHAGGIDISLTRDATGEDYCTAMAHYEGTGHPSHPVFGQLHDISYCMQSSEVNAGETFTLRSRYDHQYETLKAMGIMVTHVYEPSAPVNQ